MNFKDEYRAANNEIHGDRSILAGITNEKPKKIIYLRPVLGTAAAAAVCLVTVLAYPYITNPSTENGEAPGKTDVFVTSTQTQGQQVPDTIAPETYDATRKLAPESTGEPESVEEDAVLYNYSAANVRAQSDVAKQADAAVAFSAEETPKESAPEANYKAYNTENVAEDLGDVQTAVTGSTATPETTAEHGPETFTDKEEGTEPVSGSGGGVSSGGGAGGGSAAASSSEAAGYSLCTGVTEDEITLKHPEKGEITLKITENTLITNAHGEALSKEALQEGVTLRVFFDEAELTAEKIIIE